MSKQEQVLRIDLNQLNESALSALTAIAEKQNYRYLPMGYLVDTQSHGTVTFVQNILITPHPENSEIKVLKFSDHSDTIGSGQFGTVSNSHVMWLNTATGTVEIPAEINPEVCKVMKKNAKMHSTSHAFMTEMLSEHWITEKVYPSTLPPLVVKSPIDGEETVVMYMAKVPGQSLKSLITSRDFYKMMPGQRLSILRNIAIEIQKMHRDCRVLHQDLNIGNIMVDDDGTVRLIDFGYGADLDASERIVRHGGYMPLRAPENDTEPASEASDAYSFGGLLAHALTGISSIIFRPVDTYRKASRKTVAQCTLYCYEQFYLGSSRLNNKIHELIVQLTQFNKSDRMTLQGAIDELEILIAQVDWATNPAAKGSGSLQDSVEDDEPFYFDNSGLSISSDAIAGSSQDSSAGNSTGDSAEDMDGYDIQYGSSGEQDDLSDSRSQSLGK